MENYDFSDIRLDSNIKRYHYLPYLDYINKNLVDEYNKFILKRRFGYYQDQNNPNTYIIDEKRTINDNDRYENYKKDFENINNLLNSIYYEFNIAYEKVDFYDRLTYRSYKKMVIDNLNRESLRLNKIIDDLYEYKVDNRVKIYKFKHLVTIILTLFILTILSFIFYKTK